MTRITHICWRAVPLLLLFSNLGGPAQAQTEATAAGIEAAFLYNFGKFVEWPENVPASSPFQVCVTGDSAVKDSLQEIAKTRTINGRGIVIKKLKGSDSAQSCQILFTGRAEGASLKRILSNLGGASVLTVGESGDFTKEGGMIGFVLDSDRVRFAVNVGAAEKARLKVSSKLLTLAVAVEK